MTDQPQAPAHDPPSASLDDVGVVVIGRNEGEQIKTCLLSARAASVPVVYVDSGSTDNSIDLATSCGAVIVRLDPATPFTAARARNAGWERLREAFPSVRFVQFVDGDCTIAEGWLAAARDYFNNRSALGAVCGQLRERSPRASIYNLLCDIEWSGAAGEVDEFGGNVMLRREAFEQVEGYVETVIAAEDTEMCARLRKAGWRLERIAHDMAEHDARMSRVTQWWKRAVRSGHAHAEMSFRHGEKPISCRTRQARSNWFWGLAWPVTSVALAWPTGGWSLLMLLAYVVLYARILLRWSRLRPLFDAHWYATFCVLGKFPEALGQLRFWLNRWLGRQSLIIEHKVAPRHPDAAQM